MKICSKCNVSKEIDDFSSRTLSKDVLNPWCKPCVKIYLKSYNKDKIVKQRSEYYLSNPDPAKLRANGLSNLQALWASENLSKNNKISS
jgi:hypothetical protein